MSPIRPATKTPDDEMEFPEAIAAVITGKKVSRTSWGNDDCVFLSGGFLSLRKSDGTLHQLLVSDGDMTGNDWFVVREV
jgi:hypothetical protein